MRLNNALRQVTTTLKTYIDKVVPKKLSELEIDIEVGTVKTVNGIEPDESGNIEIKIENNTIQDSIFPSEMDALVLVAEIGFIEPVSNNGYVFTDNNEAIYII